MVYAVIFVLKVILFPETSVTTLNVCKLTLSRRRIRAADNCKVFASTKSSLILGRVAVKRGSYKSSKITSDPLGLGAAKTSMWQPPQATCSSKKGLITSLASSKDAILLVISRGLDDKKKCSKRHLKWLQI